jgi:hypothetical protein
MLNLLHGLLPKKSPMKARRTVRHFHPKLEGLEDRQVPAVTFHGGAVLGNVEVQGLYLGSGWGNNTPQVAYLESFLQMFPQSSYMDMLTGAYPNVGRGSFTPGYVRGTKIDPTRPLSDSQLHEVLMGEIKAGHLQTPDANRLYVIFVDKDVVVQRGPETSAYKDPNAFVAYHGAFNGNGSDIRYVVIPYPGGPNVTLGYTSSKGQTTYVQPQDQMTEAASEEMAEAVTDPDVGYKKAGWYDDTYNDEIGDIQHGSTVYLYYEPVDSSGNLHCYHFAVVRVVDQNDQNMTPSGATSVNQVNFLLSSAHNLYMTSFLCPVNILKEGVASVSDQGIDDLGHAMVAVVTTTGEAWEFHEGPIGWVHIASGVKMAKAGQGVSYVLTNNGSVSEYNDSSGKLTLIVRGGVTLIDSGTDRYNVNMVVVVSNGDGILGTKPGDCFEYSDSTGKHFLASNVQTVSAGRQGLILLNSTGEYSELSGTVWNFWVFALLADPYSPLKATTIGTDVNGNVVIDLLYADGFLYQFGTSTWCTGMLFPFGVQSISKAQAGVVGAVWSNNGFMGGMREDGVPYFNPLTWSTTANIQTVV